MTPNNKTLTMCNKEILASRPKAVMEFQSRACRDFWSHPESYGLLGGAGCKGL
ncbi:hypothetical protein V1290_002950 [Bradyrhizobium sp. AZCC 1578]